MTHPPLLAFFNIGPMEMFLIFAVVLVVFGPKRLPELGKSIGKGIRNFKKGMNEIDSTAEEVDVTDEKDEDAKHLGHGDASKIKEKTGPKS